MAGDWIKLRTGIFNDPDVLKMSDMCRTNRHQIVGQVSDVWGWINGHSVDGLCPNVTKSMIDAYVATPGFADAMEAVGWLEPFGDGVRFPKWDRHNSNSAKARALEAEAKNLRRTNVGQMSDTCPTKTAKNVRPEKRREEKRTNPPPIPPRGVAREGAPARAREEIDEAWIGELAANAAYAGIDVHRELGKAQAWCAAHHKLCSRRRFINWLNRADRPVAVNGTTSGQSNEIKRGLPHDNDPNF